MMRYKSHKPAEEGMDKVAVLVDTVKGNTKRVAAAIAEELGVTLGDIKRPVTDAEILFLGSGTYGGRPGYYMHLLLRDGDFTGKKVALFATAGGMKDGVKMVTAMAEALEKKGATILRTPDSPGKVITVRFRHPHEEDIEDARRWAREIIGNVPG